jgi:hypothetical protein
MASFLTLSLQCFLLPFQDSHQRIRWPGVGHGTYSGACVSWSASHFLPALFWNSQVEDSRLKAGAEWKLAGVSFGNSTIPFLTLLRDRVHLY